MNAWKKTRSAIVLTALLYLAFLGFAGELHFSSRGFVFFSVYWLLQSMVMLLQAWRLDQRGALHRHERH